MARESSIRVGEIRRLLTAPFRAARRLWKGVRAGEEQPEPPDVAVGRVLGILAGWIVFVAATLVGFGWYTLSRVDIGSPSQAVAVLPSPRLQVDPAADYDRLTAAQRKRLETYAWADRGRETVEIPVDRAMAILVGRGAGAFAPQGIPNGPETARGRAVDAATGAGATR